jgi:hypothetical protein
MIYKRFKTLLLEYVNEQPSLSSFSHVLYLDVDIVVANPLEPFLTRLLLLRRHTRPPPLPPLTPALLDNNDTASSSSSSSYMSLFPDCPTCAKNIFNSGILWLHRDHSKGCLHEWRTFMDESPHTTRDQSTLRKVKRYSAERCHLVPIQPKSDCLYPNWRDMRLFLHTNSTVFVHNSNTYGSTRIPDKVQRQYFARLLHYTTELELELDAPVEHY